jgi:hypothetical protein
MEYESSASASGELIVKLISAPVVLHAKVAGFMFGGIGVITGTGLMV